MPAEADDLLALGMPGDADLAGFWGADECVYQAYADLLRVENVRENAANRLLRSVDREDASCLLPVF